MTIISFTHLHVHSHYSLLDGFSSPEVLIEKTTEEDYPALALTEHGNVHSWYEHYKTCNENDIKPIIGCEFYITSVFAEDGLAKDEDTYHLVVLAKNDRGRNNLFSLVSLSNTEGFYYKPRISFKLLKEYSEGLIVLSACQQGEVPRHVLNENYDKAVKTAKEYKKIFGDDYYLEIMPTGTTEQYIANNNVKEISEKLNIEPVATVDIHYLNPEDERGQDVLLAVNTGKKLDDEDRLTFDSDQYYYKARREIADGLFRGHNCLDFAERACDNTLQIANKVEEYDVDTGSMYLPDYELPEDETLEEHLKNLCYNSLYELALEKDIDIDEYADRLDHEIEVISMKGYCKYFLVTADLMEWAAENNVLSGPSRGSAGGCLISYLLNITKIDPIEHDLLFTRFLNPERDSFPDIDIDLPRGEKGRDKMVEHTIEKYGRDNVAHISTFGTMGTKGALKDVGRVLDIDFFTMNKKIAKSVPGDAEDVEDAVEKSEELQGFKKKYPKLFEYAKQVEGKPRNLGTHASAIVATPEPVTNYTPLARTKDSSGNINYITQTEMHDSEELGLLKIDFLGLETLNIIENTINAVQKRDDLDKFEYIPDLDNLWEELPLDDKKVYKNIYQKADNNGVFQVESYLFTDLLKRMQPESFENIVALVALGRPGPIDAGLVDQYIDRMHGKEEVKYLHKNLEDALNDTYGVPIYQEQIMKIAREIAGFSLGEADILRRAVGKKKEDVMREVKDKFLKGAKQNGYSEEFAENLFAKIDKFSGYAFNRAHSAAYAMISYLTAYLKEYFPAEFYAALMTSEAKKSSSESSLKEYVSDCYQKGIEILPPDINESGVNFTAIGEDKIRYGLKSIKHVGGAALKNLMNNRPFGSMRDFMNIINRTVVNKTVVEALIKSGAFDEFDSNRNKLLKKYEDLKTIRVNQMSLFEDKTSANVETTEQEIIEMEMETLETSVSYPSEFDLASNGEKLTIKGVVKDKNEIYDKNDNLMAFVDLETKTDTITLVIFTDVYTKNSDLFQRGFRLEVAGKKDNDNLLLNDVELAQGDIYDKKAV